MFTVQFFFFSVEEFWFLKSFLDEFCKIKCGRILRENLDIKQLHEAIFLIDPWEIIFSLRKNIIKSTMSANKFCINSQVK